MTVDNHEYEEATFPLTIKEAEAIIEALKYQYINREDDAFYTIITSLARFVEKNK